MKTIDSIKGLVDLETGLAKLTPARALAITRRPALALFGPLWTAFWLCRPWFSKCEKSFGIIWETSILGGFEVTLITSV